MTDKNNSDSVHTSSYAAAGGRREVETWLGCKAGKCEKLEISSATTHMFLS